MARTNTTTDLTLTVEALTARANQRRRAATSMAASVALEDRAGKDVRPGALTVTRELAKAADLDRLASALTTGALTLAGVSIAAGEFRARTPEQIAADLAASAHPQSAETATLTAEHDVEDDDLEHDLLTDAELDES